MTGRAIASGFVLLLLTWVCAGGRWSVPARAADDANQEECIPVRNPLVIERCSPCHQRDDRGCLTRISSQRRTPEGWEAAIKRMVRLNGLSLAPDDARQIVKYLSNHHGLAPEEARPAFYEAEHRVVNENVPDETVRSTCTLCHGLGRIISQRRAGEEWRLLANLHIGMFPFVSTQGFYRYSPAPGLPDLPETDHQEPVDRAVQYFSKTYPLVTPEWQSWRAGMHSPKLEGRWLVSGYRPGKGRVFGETTITAVQAEDEFKTACSLVYIKDGSTEARTGRAIVYGGYSWRERLEGSAKDDPVRQSLMLSRDWTAMDGRMFWGAYDEFGVDVVLRRIGREPLISGADLPALRSGASSTRLAIYGANLPVDIKASEVDLGAGITVNSLVSATGDKIVVDVGVDSKAPNGLHAISLRNHVRPDAIAVFDKIDYIKISPGTGLARIGGAKYPKDYQQFEAIAYNRGPDGEVETSDDLNLGAVDAQWSIEEFPSGLNDDDKDFVGSIDEHGLFTPAIEGPNPKRRNSRNNSGDVWIVAALRPGGSSKSESVLIARAYLLVTFPLYVRWDPSTLLR